MKIGIPKELKNNERRVASLMKAIVKPVRRCCQQSKMCMPLPR